MNPFHMLDSPLVNNLLNLDELNDFPCSEESTSSVVRDLSDGDSNSDKQQQDNIADFHPISCIRCRRMHKFCSKAKPACERCSKRGVECIYREPKKTSKTKRKRDASDEVDDNQSSPKHMVVLSDEILHVASIEHYSPWYFSIPHLNFFVTTYSGKESMLLLSRDAFEKFMLNNESCGIVEDNLLERNAFYLSVQALWYQSCGKLDLAEESGTSCKKLISQSFKPSSILVSYTYLNLGLFETGRGNVEISNFYLYCSKFGIQTSTLTTENLKRTVSFVEQFSLGEMDVLRFSSRLPVIYEFICGNTLTPQLMTLLQQNITKENCHEIVNTGSELIKLFISMMKDRRKDEIESCGLQFTQKLLIEGLKLGVFVASVSRTDLIEECSLEITYLCDNETFQYCSMFMIPFIVMATRVNIQVVKSITNGSRVNCQIGKGEGGTLQPIDYYEILRRNQRALLLLNSRFSLVSVMHGKLLSTLDEILTKSQASTNSSEI